MPAGLNLRHGKLLCHLLLSESGWVLCGEACSVEAGRNFSLQFISRHSDISSRAGFYTFLLVHAPLLTPHVFLNLRKIPVVKTNTHVICDRVIGNYSIKKFSSLWKCDLFAKSCFWICRFTLTGLFPDLKTRKGKTYLQLQNMVKVFLNSLFIFNEGCLNFVFLFFIDLFYLHVL